MSARCPHCQESKRLTELEERVATLEGLIKGTGTSDRFDGSLSTIVETVGRLWLLKPAVIIGPQRTKRISEARQVVFYIACLSLDESLVEIGRWLGGRDHSTVIYGRDRATARLATDSAFADRVTGALAALGLLETEQAA